MPKQSEIEERILGLMLGLGIGTMIGFLLRGAERRREDSPRDATPGGDYFESAVEEELENV